MGTIKNHAVQSMILITANTYVTAGKPSSPQQNALLLVCTVLEYEDQDREIQDGYRLFLHQMRLSACTKSVPITRSAIRRFVQKAEQDAIFELQDTQKHLRKEFTKKLPTMFQGCTQQDFENAYDYITEYKPYPQTQSTRFYYKKALETIESHEESEPILPAISVIPVTSQQSSKASAGSTTSTSTKFPKIIE